MEEPVGIKRRNVCGPACRYYKRSLCRDFRSVVVAYRYGLMFHFGEIIHAQRYDSVCAKMRYIKIKNI